MNYHHATNLRHSFRCAAGIVALATIFVSVPVSAGNKKSPLQLVNLNTATALESQQVPRFGPSTTDKILKIVKSCGQFKSVDDLRAIKGIGPKRMEKNAQVRQRRQTRCAEKGGEHRGNFVGVAVYC